MASRINFISFRLRGTGPGCVCHQRRAEIYIKSRRAAVCWLVGLICRKQSQKPRREREKSPSELKKWQSIYLRRRKEKEKVHTKYGGDTRPSISAQTVPVIFLAAKEGQSLWKFSLCPTTPLDSAHSVLKSSYKYIGGNV